MEPQNNMVQNGQGFDPNMQPQPQPAMQQPTQQQYPQQGQQMGYGYQQPMQQAQPMQQVQQPYPQQQQGYVMPGAKSSTTAGLLGIFLGSVGAHEFYLGNKKLGIIHLCLVGGGVVMLIISGVLTASSVSYSSLLSGSYGAKLAIAGILSTVGGIASSASGIWGLITGIMCFAKSGKYGHDANGNPLV